MDHERKEHPKRTIDLGTVPGLPREQNSAAWGTGKTEELVTRGTCTKEGILDDRGDSCQSRNEKGPGGGVCVEAGLFDESRANV